MPANEDQSLHNSFVKRFAFNIYDRLPACLTRQSTEKRGPNSVSALMPEAMPLGTHPLRTFVAPSFHLVSHSASQATLQLQWPPPALDVMDANRLLHIAYGFSTDRKWLYLTSIDDRAEYNCLRVRFVGGLETRAILRRVWNFMREASEWASVEWRICICRLGALYAAEVHGEAAINLEPSVC